MSERGYEPWTERVKRQLEKGEQISVSDAWMLYYAIGAAYSEGRMIELVRQEEQNQFFHRLRASRYGR